MAGVSATFTGSIPDFYDGCLGPAWFGACAAAHSLPGRYRTGIHPGDSLRRPVTVAPDNAQPHVERRTNSRLRRLLPARWWCGPPSTPKRRSSARG